MGLFWNEVGSLVIIVEEVGPVSWSGSMGLESRSKVVWSLRVWKWVQRGLVAIGFRGLGEKGELLLLKWVVLGGEVCKKVVGLWSGGEGLVIIVEECGELVRLMGLGSGFLEVVLAGFGSRSKVVGCRVSQAGRGELSLLE